MNSNSFSWARMWALTCRNAAENKRRLLMSAGVVFGLVLLIFILISKSFAGDYGDSVLGRAWGVMMAFISLSAIAMQLSGSLTFSSYNSKARRISCMMLPAAQSEKFLSNIALYIVAGNIVLLLCMVLADCISAAIFGIAPAISQIPFKEITASGRSLEICAAMGLAWLWVGLFAQSLYVAGSALWPKYSFAKTFVALLSIQIILPIILPLDLAGSALHAFMNIFKGLSATGMHIAGWSLIACLYIILACVYVAAWQIFKRTQVIQRFKMK